MKCILIKIGRGYLITEYFKEKEKQIKKIEDIEYKIVETDDVEIVGDKDSYFTVPRINAEELWNGSL